MKAATGVIILACGVLMIGLAPHAARGQAAGDPLAPFLRGLADSTDATFGSKAAVFDTTGVDSLIRVKASAAPDSSGMGGKAIQFSPSPILDFHRATGLVGGVRVPVHFPGGTTFRMEGSYGLSNKEGRYLFGLSRDVWSTGGMGGGNLGIDISYARQTVRFAAEHATPVPSALGALFSGIDRQSVYERRGISAALTWSEPQRFARAGWRHMHDQSMPRATTFTLWGRDSAVPPVTPADPGSYDEGFASVATTRSGLPFIGADGKYSSGDRWRARLAAAERIIAGPIETHIQAEGGMSASTGPRQNEFELGGALAVPSLGLGDEAGNRLLLGKVEIVHGIDLVRALRIPYISYMPMHPAVFAQGGSAWAARDGSWDAPPDASWRGAAGIALIHIPGFPTETTQMRLQMAWPVGRDSGVARFSMSIGDWFDVLPGK